MKLKTLTTKNFMPYKGEHTISFPTDHQRNVMLVFGDNMRGKTSFLNAIRWCFFSKALGRHLKEIERVNIVNIDAAKENDWNVSVSIIFESNGHEYDLRRTMHPKEMIYKPKNDNDFLVEIGLRKDGSVLRADQIEHEINQIMPEDIARFFLFDGELLQEYEMLLDDKDQQGQLIKDAIEKVLGVPALIKARDEIDVLLRDARKKQTRDSVQIDSVKRYSEQLQKLEVEYESLDRDLKESQAQASSAQSQIDLLETELQQSQSILVGKERLDLRKGELKRCEERMEVLREKKLAVLKEAWKDLLQPLMQEKIDALASKRSTFTDRQKEKFTVENRIESLSKILKFSVCPTCDQNLDEAKRDSIGTELGKLEVELEQFRTDLDSFGAISEEITKLNRLKSSGAMLTIPQIDRELRECNLRTVELDSDITEIEIQLRGHDTAEISKKRSKRESLIKMVAGIENNIKEAKSKIDENERNQRRLEASISANADARGQKSTRVVNTYLAMKDIFSDSINALRDNLRQNVAELSSSAFSKLTTEPTYKCLKINENYGLTIVDREDRDVAQRSAGAEQIVALSLIDGLNRTARKTGPIVMDTPLGRLDLKHRERVLNYIPDMGEQVILLVHEGEIEKDRILDSLKTRIGKVYNIERVSSSESKLVEG